MNRLLVRCDASPEIGVGHVMRCLALAQQWQGRGGKVTFCCHSIPASLGARLTNAGMEVTVCPASPGSIGDASWIAGQASPGSALVLDGYLFDDEYEATATVGWDCVLAFDDYGHALHHHCDLILNQNPTAPAVDYSKSGALVLSGLDYCQLRTEFLAPNTDRQAREIGQKLLITFGGSDPPNATARVVSAVAPLLSSMDLKLRVVLGAGYRHPSPLAGLSMDPQTIQMDHDVDNMVPLYQWADLAICGGGSSNWEMSCLGVPRLVIPIAENQRPVARQLAANGVCEILEDGTPEQLRERVRQLLLSSGQRNQMMMASRSMVDGRGSQRVVDHLLNQLNCQKRKQDCGK